MNSIDYVITDTQIDELIKIGKKYSHKNAEYIIENADNLQLNFDKKLQYALVRCFGSSCRDYDKIYTKTILKYIFMGAIIGEIYLVKGVGGYGSVSCSSRMIWVLYDKDPMLAYTVKKWAYEFGFRSYWYSRNN